MVRNRFTKGVYNGFEVEFGKVYSNPMLSAFIPMNEAKGDKKLRVFDFDDTLVKTKSHIYITHKDGKNSKLTPGEYAIYEPKEGDKFDFSDFESVKRPQEIKGVTRLLKNILRVGGSDVVILTARSSYRPVKDYLKDVGIDDIFVVALADADPQKKADWIEDKIKGGVNDVFFIDDSHKNVAAVKKLAKKYPKISLKVRHVQHEIPKDKNDIKGNMKLKNLLPKMDLEKKIKNPETGKMIKLGSALKYDKDTKAYKAAQFALKKK
jgi:sulfur carrier protein ThiS